MADKRNKSLPSTARPTHLRSEPSCRALPTHLRPELRCRTLPTHLKPEASCRTLPTHLRHEPSCRTLPRAKQSIPIIELACKNESGIPKSVGSYSADPTSVTPSVGDIVEL